jgi:anti-anti-sigma factor
MQYEIEDYGQFKMIHIRGNIDSQTSSKLLDSEISRLIDEGNHRFIFNLKKTTYLDSAGISIFIHCLCDVQENNGSIYILAQENQVLDVLEMVGINRLIKTYTSEDEFIREHSSQVPVT